MNILNKNQQKDEIREILDTQKDLDMIRGINNKNSFGTSDFKKVNDHSINYLLKHGLVRKIDTVEETVIAHRKGFNAHYYTNTKYAYDIKAEKIVPMCKIESGRAYEIKSGLVATVSRNVYAIVYDSVAELKNAIVSQLNQENFDLVNRANSY